jgi:DNA-binding transcriptional LysR family regulator
VVAARRLLYGASDVKLDLAALKLFVRADERGSISAAARELGWLPATASAALLRAEEELGGRLFARTTRSLKATPQGQRFLERARLALATLDDAREDFASERESVRGLIRLSAPTDIGEQLVLPALDAFLEGHPAVHLALQLSDEVRDLAREDVDAGIRYGAVTDGNLIARKLADSRRILVASPAYIARRGIPRQPDDLASHECLLLKTRSRRPDLWRLARGPQTFEIRAHGRRLADNGALTRRWALAGHGIALKSWIDVCEDVAQGRLARVLPGVIGESYPLTLVMSPGVRLATRMRTLGDWLVERFAARMRQFPFPDRPERSG